VNTPGAAPGLVAKGLASITLLTPWMVWEHRNDCIFNGAQPSTANLVAQIKDEAALLPELEHQGLE
jgi:hypothetical protein